MTANDQLESLYDSTLRPRIAALEQLRLALRGYLIKSAVLIGVPGAIFYFRDLISLALPDAISIALGTVSFIGIFVGVVIAGFKYLLPGLTAYANYKGRFKQEVVAEIVKVVCPTATYTPNQGIPASVFDSPGVFSASGSYATDDRIRGKIGRTPFEAAEVHRWYSTGSGKDSKTYHVFQGLFFHFDFNKSLRGVTIVQPEDASAFQIGDRKGLSLATFENPEFEKVFKVFASNEVEARYVLTPAMMERLLAVRAEAGRPIFLGFRDNGFYLGVQYGRSLFEPNIASTTSKEAILEMAGHFSLAEEIVQELDLNTRIWTKDVDESLLSRPDPEAPKSILDAGAAGGTLTQKDLWAGAGIALGEEYKKEIGAEIPKPERTLGRIDRAPDGTLRVRYGWSFSLLFAMLVSISSVAIALSALRRIGADAGSTLGAFGPTLAGLPTVPELDGLVGEYGWVWLGAAVVVGGLFTLAWLVRVRRVDVTPDATLVYRGLRPFPRRYARTEYDSVLRLKNSVHLSRSQTVSLMNPTASPNLKEAEAGWVASELRKALNSRG